MPEIEVSRYYPAEPDETYTAVVDSVRALAQLKATDDFSRSVSFTTRMTGWASGANVTGSIRPDQGGCTVRFEGQAKVRTQVNANNAAHQQLVAILDETGRIIRARRELTH